MAIAVKDDYIYLHYDSINNNKVYAYDKNVEVIGDLIISPTAVTSTGKVRTNSSKFISDNFSFSDELLISESTEVTLNHNNHKLGLLKAEDVFFKFDIMANEMEFKSNSS